MDGLDKSHLISSTISIYCNYHVRFLQVFVSKCQSCAKGRRSPNNTPAAPKIVLSLIQMHRTSLAQGTPCPLAHQL